MRHKVKIVFLISCSVILWIRRAPLSVRWVACRSTRRHFMRPRQYCGTFLIESASIWSRGRWWKCTFLSKLMRLMWVDMMFWSSLTFIDYDRLCERRVVWRYLQTSWWTRMWHFVLGATNKNNWLKPGVVHDYRINFSRRFRIWPPKNHFWYVYNFTYSTPLSCSRHIAAIRADCSAHHHEKRLSKFKVSKKKTNGSDADKFVQGYSQKPLHFLYKQKNCQNHKFCARTQLFHDRIVHSYLHTSLVESLSTLQHINSRWNVVSINIDPDGTNCECPALQVRIRAFDFYGNRSHSSRRKKLNMQQNTVCSSEGSTAASTHNHALR